MVALLLVASVVSSQARTFYTLPTSNGFASVLADASQGKVTRFYERIAATEEPQLDVAGNVVTVSGVPLDVLSRNLLFDAYFGIRAQGTQRWLSGVPTGSTYENGIVTWTQQSQGLTLTTYVFSPRALPHAGFVMLLHVEGAGATAAFTLHNYHLGFGRPAPQANGETITVAANHDLLERAFAGVVVTRPLGTVAHALGWNAATAAAGNGFAIVQNTTGDFPDSPQGDLGVADDSASGFQFALTGSDAWLGVAVVHHGDPFGGATAQGWLDAYVGSKTPQQLLQDERDGWVAFQASLTLPAGLTADEEKVARQSAVMLSMAQNKEAFAYLREWLSRDGEPRKSKFSTALPGTVAHHGAGAVLASLPPGEWTYAWVRDGAYAAAAMASVGMKSQAKDALGFVLQADALPSLTRYTGFGVPEQDVNAFGPNVEYDGYGLTLWAMRKAGVDDLPKTRAIADAIVALIDPATGLMKKDSSIWETHTMGRERTWTFTNLTAVRGLCDAAAMDPARADTYRAAAVALRAQIAAKLTDGSGALVSNLEELKSGSAYADAAVLDAFELGLFAPTGPTATATLALLDAKLKAQVGPGWSRNDDRTNANGLSPWGSEYDSAEWVFTDLRGSRLKATRAYTTAQAAANVGVIPETYDEHTGAWKFNAPMIGFGAGAYLLSLGPPEAPACGAYFEDEHLEPDGGVSHPMPEMPTPKHCGCASAPGTVLLLLLYRRRRV